MEKIEISNRLNFEFLDKLNEKVKKDIKVEHNLECRNSKHGRDYSEYRKNLYKHNYFEILNYLESESFFIFLENSCFREIFFKVVFSGNPEIFLDNLNFLITHNITDIKSIINIFMFDGKRMASYPFSEIKKIFDKIVSSSMMYFPNPEYTNFNYVLLQISKGETEIPIFFDMCYPAYYLSNKYLLSSIRDVNPEEVISIVLSEYENSALENLRFQILSNSNIGNKRNTLFNILIADDREFITSVYGADIAKSLIELNFSNSILSECLLGGYKILYKRLQSIQKELGISVDLFEYLIVDENNRWLMEDILYSLDCTNDKDFIKFKKNNFDEAILELVGEFCSKLYLYASINMKKTASLLSEKCFHTLVLLSKKMVKYKDNSLIDEEFYTEVNRILSIYSNNGSSFKNSLNNDLMSEINSHVNSDLSNDVSFLYLFLLDDEFVMKINNLSVNSIIENSIKLVEGKKFYCPDLENLLFLVPDLYEYLGIDSRKVKNINKVEDAYITNSVRTSYLSKINDCSSFDFFVKYMDSNKINTDSNNILKLINDMFQRYMGKYSLPGASNKTGDFTQLNVMSSKLQQMYLEDSNNLIHILNYLLYLENNIAHSYEYDTINRHLKENNYFSLDASFSKNKSNSSNFKVIGNTIRNFVYSIGKSDIDVDFDTFIILIKVMSILEDDTLTTVAQKSNSIFSYLLKTHSITATTTMSNACVDLINSFTAYGKEFIQYYRDIIEQKMSFTLKRKYSHNIISKFYEDLFRMRKFYGIPSRDFYFTDNEAVKFYNHYGYLINIERKDSVRRNISSGNNTPSNSEFILYILDKNFDVTHSIHMVDHSFNIEVNGTMCSFDVNNIIVQKGETPNTYINDVLDSDGNKYAEDTISTYSLGKSIYCSKNFREIMEFSTPIESSVVNKIVVYISSIYPDIYFFNEDMLIDISLHVNEPIDVIRKCLKAKNDIDFTLQSPNIDFRI